MSSTTYTPIFTPPPLFPPTGLTLTPVAGGFLVTLTHDTTPTVRFAVIEVTNVLDDYTVPDATGLIPWQENYVLISGLLGSTTYYVRAKSIDVWGNESDWDDATGITVTTGAVATGNGTGQQGPPGFDGADGEPGPPGQTGPAGAPGANGSNGAAGATGAQGSTIPYGMDGEDGEQGIPGKDGKDSVSNKATFQWVVGTGVAVVTVGLTGYFEVPFNCTLDTVSVYADASGSIVFDVWKDTYGNFPPVVGDTITASAKPTLSSAQKATDSTLTGWNKSWTAGDVIGINVDSATTVKKVTLAFRVTKT